MTATFIHPTAEVSPEAIVGDGCRVWRQVHIREHAVVGAGSIIGAGVYVGEHVQLGRNCKIQNNVSLYTGVVLEDHVLKPPRTWRADDIRFEATSFGTTAPRGIAFGYCLGDRRQGLVSF